MSSTIIFFLFVPLLSLILLTINIIFAPHNPYVEKNNPFECGFTSFLGQNRIQFSISFFIFALLFLLFDLEILLVYPYLISAYINETYGLLILIIFIGVLTIGFIFELGKKALTIDSRQTMSSNKNLKNLMNKSSFITPNTTFYSLNLINSHTKTVNFHSSSYVEKESNLSKTINNNIRELNLQWINKNNSILKYNFRNSIINNDKKRYFSITTTLKTSTVYDNLRRLKNNSDIVKQQLEKKGGNVGAIKNAIRNITRQEISNKSILNDNKVTSKWKMESYRCSTNKHIHCIYKETFRKPPVLPKWVLEAKIKGICREVKVEYTITNGHGDKFVSISKPDVILNPEVIKLRPIHTTEFNIPDDATEAFDLSFVTDNPGVLNQESTNKILKSTNMDKESVTVVNDFSDKIPTLEPKINSSELVDMVGKSDFDLISPTWSFILFMITSPEPGLVESPLRILIEKFKYIKNYFYTKKKC